MKYNKNELLAYARIPWPFATKKNVTFKEEEIDEAIKEAGCIKIGNYLFSVRIPFILVDNEIKFKRTKKI